MWAFTFFVSHIYLQSTKKCFYSDLPTNIKSAPNPLLIFLYCSAKIISSNMICHQIRLFSLWVESISRLCWLEINIDMSVLCLQRWLNDSYLISDSSPSSGSNANTDLLQFICDILTIRNSYEWLGRLFARKDILCNTYVKKIKNIKKFNLYRGFEQQSKFESPMSCWRCNLLDYLKCNTGVVFFNSISFGSDYIVLT